MEKRTPKKIRADEGIQLNAQDYSFYEKGVFAWKLPELPPETSFMQHNLPRSSTKVNKLFSNIS